MTVFANAFLKYMQPALANRCSTMMLLVHSMNKNNFHRYLTEVDLYIHSIEKIAASQAALFVALMCKLSLIKQSLTDIRIFIKKAEKAVNW